MRIILKFLLKNLFEKKFRAFLILFSITISAALFFASGAISGTMSKMVSERVKQYFGTCDLIAVPGEKSQVSFFRTNGAEPFKNELEYAVGAVQGSGTYKKSKSEVVNVSVTGYNYEELQKMNPFLLKDQSSLLPFEGNKLIMGKNTAEKYNIRCGDSIDIEIGGAARHFTVSGIAYPSGPFIDETQGIFFIVPKSKLSSIYNINGVVNIMYIKLKDPLKKQSMIDRLSKAYDKLDVKEPIPMSELNEILGKMTTPYMMMTFIVALMSIFIIYTSFKVIAMERMPVIGTLRSIGATKKTTNIILITESILYGLLGGIAGCLLGIGFLYLMAQVTISDASGFKATINFSNMQVIATLLFALVLCFFGSMIPILKVTRISIKDIVLNTLQQDYRKKLWKGIAGPALLMVSLVIPRLVPDTSYTLVIFINTLCMLLTVISVVLFIPFFTSFIVILFEKIYVYIFGNVGILAAKNLKDNKSILNNISLVTIGLATLLLISVLNGSISREVTGIFVNSMKFDLTVFSPYLEKTSARILARADGVQSVYPSYQTYGVAVGDGKNKIGTLTGIDPIRYFEYWKIELSGNAQEMLKDFDKSRNIILTNTLKDRFHVKVGDFIDLNFNSGKKSYRVKGFFNTLMNNGDMALVPENYLKFDSQLRYYSSIYIKTDKDPKEVADNLKNQYARAYISVETREEQRISSEKSNQQTFAILNGFSYMAMIIGIFGVLNNLIICFLERKRSLAVLRSIGMSKNQIVRMFFIESFTSGIIGGLLGVISGVLMLSISPYMLKVIIGTTLKIHFEAGTLISYFVAAVFIMLIASITPAMRSSKLSILESIKYE